MDTGSALRSETVLSRPLRSSTKINSRWSRPQDVIKGGSVLPNGVSLADLGRYSRVIIRFESALTCCVVVIATECRAGRSPNGTPETKALRQQSSWNRTFLKD